ncbi:Homeodomain-like protein, partial [Emericellopsis atlantica]
MRQPTTLSPRKPTKGPWSKAEDRQLVLARRVCGSSSWTAIAIQMPGRSAKQCRERYHQNLDENLCHDPISPAEGQWIIENVSRHGKRWAHLSRLMGNRSDNAIKNWWNG